jgi:branched-chain amino acid transport system permease protein
VTDRGRVERLRDLLEGQNTLGNSTRFWYGFILVVAFVFAYPLLTNPFVLKINTDYFIWMILALSLAVVWGYTGIFNFGQTAFFGLGAYTFGVVGITLIEVTGGTNVAILTAVVVTMVASALLGYFMFYGEIRGLYVAILTLAVALTGNLLLVRTTNTTIGAAELGGNNGITGIPSLTVGGGQFSATLGITAQYYLVAALLVATYLGLRMLLNSYYGYVLVAIREDEDRTRMLGYDVRRLKLIAFSLTAGLAGFAGALHAAWGNFIDPTVMGLTAASVPIIWVTVGGRNTLIGPLVAAYALQSISTRLSTVGSGYTNIFLGAVFVLSVLFFPDGLVPAVVNRWQERTGGGRDVDPAATTEAET